MTPVLARGGARWLGRAALAGFLWAAANDCGGSVTPGTGHWETLPDSPQSTGGESTLMWNGTEVIAPSSLGLLSYDPAQAKWSVLSAPSPIDYPYTNVSTVLAKDVVVTFGESDCGMNPIDVYLMGQCPTAQAYSLPADATKNVSLVGAPSTRTSGTLLWTGTRVLVWGGSALSTTAVLENLAFSDGGLYDPVTDSWTPIAASPLSPARAGHLSVWTGSEMLLWGGETGPEVIPLGATAVDPYQPAAAGAAYNVATQTWRKLQTKGQPSPREEAVAVWTGTEMIVWGGGLLPEPDLLDHAVADGAAYDPATDTWRPIRSAPGPLVGAAVGWTGKEMLVWGGADSKGYTNTGYRYDVAADSWQTLTTVDAPSPRNGAGAVWTGTGFLVWGGVAGDFPPDSPSRGGIWFPDAGDGG